MAAEEATTLAGLFSNKTVLDFVGIAVVAPIIASIIAIITARMGITGRIRRLELAEKRIEVITSLLSKSDIDDDIRIQLRAQMNDITADIISEYGGATDDSIPLREHLAQRRKATKWSDLPLWRRYLCPPFTKSILSWICGFFYYYLLITTVTVLIAFVSFMLDGTAVSDDYIGAAILIPFFGLISMLPRAGMRHAYNNAYAGRIERQRVSEHTRTSHIAT